MRSEALLDSQTTVVLWIKDIRPIRIKEAAFSERGTILHFDGPKNLRGNYWCPYVQVK